jgi:spore coat protein U-like protein
MAACTVSTTPVPFGIYLGTSSLSGTGTITTRCGRLPFVSNVIVRMGAGQNSRRGFVTRSLKSASGQLLNYNLYTDVAHTQIWGDGTAGTVFQRGFKLTIYGLLPGGQAAIPGTYNDTVLVTIIW